MKILCIGDVVGSGGISALSKVIFSLKNTEKIDLTIINGENSADGNGLTNFSARELFSLGADVITGGNHTLKRKEIHDYLEVNDRLLRPHNLKGDLPGKGYSIIDMGYTSVLVINLIGNVYLNENENPFSYADEILNIAKENNIKIIIVDFHAEATSEKKALFFYLKDRISAFFGTHTHVQTADEEIIGGCGYITDVGMVGAENSVLGVKPELSIAKIKDKLPVKFENASAPYLVNAIIFDIDNNSGRCEKIKRIFLREIND